MYSIYSYPVDASCSSHYARDDIKSHIFFCAFNSMETIVVSTGWLVFISVLTILHQLEIKRIIIIKCCLQNTRIYCSNIFKFISVGMLIITFTSFCTIQALLFEIKVLICRLSWGTGIFWSIANISHLLACPEHRRFVLIWFCYSYRFYRRNGYMLGAVLRRCS